MCLFPFSALFFQLGITKAHKDNGKANPRSWGGGGEQEQIGWKREKSNKLHRAIISCHKFFFFFPSCANHILKEKTIKENMAVVSSLGSDPNISSEFLLYPFRTIWLLSLEGDSQPYLSMLMAQRFRMLAVHIMTSRVTKTSQQMRLKFQTPPVTWALETRRVLVFSQEGTITQSALLPPLSCSSRMPMHLLGSPWWVPSVPEGWQAQRVCQDVWDWLLRKGQNSRVLVLGEIFKIN